jgi:hypothetical protein
LYAGAKECGTEDLFGWMSVWRDPDHDHFRVSYKEDGLDRGSLKVRSAREFNLTNFELETQFAYGFRRRDVRAEIIGIKNEYCSRVVNSFLDQEEQTGRLWSRDVGYFEFLNLLEDYKQRVASEDAAADERPRG